MSMRARAPRNWQRLLARRARDLVQGAVDLLLPPLCLACGRFVHTPSGVCAECWSGLDFVTSPLCERCGRPFDFETPDETVCGGCLEHPPDFDRARAALLYDAASRPLILRFKHADALQMAPMFAAWMRQAGDRLLAETDLIAPVPLHRGRLLARRYNQSAELARVLGRVSGVEVWPDLLIRHRRTRSQGGFGRAGRDRNVRGAFRIDDTALDRLRDRRVLLIDDVMTSGATVNACARLLRRKGATSVDVLTVARVN